MKTLLSLLSLGICCAHAGNWPRFRGADGSGIATDATPPVTWSDTENLKWKTPLPGPGSSSPIIWGDRIFLTCYSGYGDGSEGSIEALKRHLLCVDRGTGKILSNTPISAEMPEDPYSGFLTEHGYASSTPVTDGEHLFAFFGKSGVVAFDMNGQRLWQTNVGKSSSNRRWGSGASPVLYKNLVIVNAAEESRAVWALDKATGREVWRAPGDALELCYSTPALLDHEGRTDLLLAVPGEVWGLNPDTGKLRWFANTGITGNVSPSVIVSGGVIYVTGGFPGLASAAIKAGGKGDVTQSHLLWTSKDASYVPSPVLVDGRIFVATDQGFALCTDAKDAKLIFRERLPGAASTGRGSKPFYASAVAANGNIYAVSRRGGVFVFPAKPEFKLTAHNKLTDDSDFNATPALSDRQLFLRSNKFLYCLEAPQTGK